MIRPKMTYCCTLHPGLSQYHKDKLQAIQNKVQNTGDAGIISTTALIFEATIKFLGVNKYGNNALITPRASTSFSRMA